MPFCTKVRVLARWLQQQLAEGISLHQLKKSKIFIKLIQDIF
jgi:hypothetical protein